jgi:hypothetical protein
MQQSTYAGVPGYGDEVASNRESALSGVSWASVLAGAVATAALSLTLLALGAGFGLLSVSPWSHSRTSAAAITAAAIAWLIIVQIAASGAGGYLAGRLRTKWAALHTDEVYFRDTAHGFLVWAVAVVITAAFLGSATAAMVGHVATAETGDSESAYFVSSLFRSAPSSATNSSAGNEYNATARQEAGAILALAATGAELTTEDRAYLTGLISARTGLSQNEAARRAAEVLQRARESADAARKATARMLLWTFLALLTGAFCASYAATVGGRQRDRVKPG